MNYVVRLEKLQKILTKLNCEAILIDDPINLLYLTGLEISTGKLLISKQGSCLIVDGRYIEKCSQQTLYPVALLEKFVLSDWLQAHAVYSLGFDSDKTSYQSYIKLRDSLKEVNLIAIPSPLQRLRLIKEEKEIESLRQSAQLAVKGSKHVISLLRQGVTEEELAFELEFFWKKQGAKKLAFDPIIAFGANSSMPHYRAGKTALQEGMCVLIDIGVVYQHYHSDMTRVVYFGTPDPRIQVVYAIVAEAKQRAMELCRPGTLVGELDQTARHFITSQGYGEYFTHSLGHGVGLEIHEPPTIRTQNVFGEMPLEAGMVLTIEPGIYLPGIGGVRLEDTLLITEEGYENLTQEF